nr:hypothetical protein [Streptomyces canus]
MSTTHGSPPTRRTRVPEGLTMASRRATGAAVSAYSRTVPTITRKATGKIFSAPLSPRSTRLAENADAVAAATMPRGAVHPMKARSPWTRPECAVAAKETKGRTTRTRIAIRARAGRRTGTREDGVTVVEMETNSKPMIN